MLTDLFSSFWNSFASKILGILPKSPLVDNAALEALRTYAGYINYFIPVGPYLTFLSALLACVAGYYAVMVILRFMRLIK